MLEKVEKLNPAERFKKIKQMTPQEVIDMIGNGHADRAAQEANFSHPINALDDDINVLNSKNRHRTKLIARVIGTMLAYWPSNREKGIIYESPRTTRVSS